jgi:long-chain acyl-CoA synthetase
MVQADPSANTTDLLVARVRETPDTELFAVPDGSGGWRDVTAAEFHAQVVALAKGFAAAGIQPGDKIGIMARTSYEWTLVDFAVWFSGAILVPIYDTSAPSQILWNLTDSGATSVIFENVEFFSRFDEIRAEVPGVSQVWNLGSGDLQKLMEQGRDVPDEEIERRRNLATGSDIATLIYTSGSTGSPKGCVLTHSNFVELTRNSVAAFPEVLNTEASTLLFITLSHIFARFISVLAVVAGARVGHQPDTSKLVEALGSFRPTFLLAVPRVFEKVYNSAEQTAEAGGKGKIFRSAAAVAVAHSKALDAGHVPLGLRLKFRLFDRLVYSKLRARLGGRVQFAVSGSAPLGLTLGHFFRSIGLQILEGWGLTETTAPVSVNLPSHFKIGKVGKPLPGNSVKLAEDGELLVKGVCVFDGYWHNEAATQDAFDADGWYRTGDLGTIDEDGFIEIIGRKKEILITAGGKNIAPAQLEDPIRSNTVIGQVVVVGDRKPFVSALITLDEEMLPVWLQNHGEDPNLAIADAAKHPKILAEVQHAIDRANSRVSRAESVRKFAILPSTWTEASGHLTPKLSIKRHVITKDFADTIEGLYQGTPLDTQSLPTH